MTDDTIVINIDGKTGTILMAGEMQLYKSGRLSKEFLIKKAMKSLEIWLEDSLE